MGLSRRMGWVDGWLVFLLGAHGYVGHIPLSLKRERECARDRPLICRFSAFVHIEDTKVLC